jgi:hypothetical protein
LVKRKLTSTPEGEASVERVESGDLAAIESMKAPLEAALRLDPVFASQLSHLVVANSGNLTAIGDNNKQASAPGSTNVTINIS